MDDFERLHQTLAAKEAVFRASVPAPFAKENESSQIADALHSAILSVVKGNDVSSCAAEAVASVEKIVPSFARADALDAINEFELAVLKTLDHGHTDGVPGSAVLSLSRFFCESRRLLSASSCSQDPKMRGQHLLASDGALRLFDDVVHEILNPSLGVETVLKMICEGAIRLTAAVVVAIYSVEPQTRSFLLKQVSLSPRHREKEKHLPRFHEVFSSIPRNPDDADGLFHTALVQGKPVFTEDVANDPRVHKHDVLEQLGVHSMLVVPMLESGNELGFMAVVPPSQVTFTQAETENLRLFTDMAAVALRNAQLYGELRKSEQRFRGLLDNATDIIFLLDKEGEVTSVNKRAEQILGFQSDRWLGHHFSEFVIEEDRETAFEGWRKGWEGRSDVLAVHVKDVRNNLVSLKVNSSLIREADEVVGLMCIARDATDEIRREAEFHRLHESMVDANRKLEDSMAQLKAAQAKLVQTEKLSAMGELISGIAHELNNPLTGIMGYTQLLLEAIDNRKHRQDLEKINHAALRCKQIIQNLLRFSRSHKPHKQPLELNSIINSVVELKRYQLHLDSIKLALKLAPEELHIMGDPFQLQQVILNIVNNAHQAITSGKTGGTIEIGTFADLAEERIRVGISDDGPGIPPDVLPKIFDPFFTTKEIGGGTGLGLSVAYGIMEEHGGQVTAESVPGVRTEFRLDLPMHKAPAPPLWDSREKPQASQKKTSVLVVDDEEVILDLLTDILVQMDKHVERAHNGAEALFKIDSNSFDIIICDLKMPGMDGKTFYYKIRETRPELTRRIIFSTGDTLGEDFRSFCLQTECKVVEKPFLLEDLKNAIEMLEQELFRGQENAAGGTS